MEDKNLMEDLLLLEKGVCDLYLHGSIESSTPNTHKVFCTALCDSLDLQDKTYKYMESKGWYKTEEVESSKVNSVKQKFVSQTMG